MMMIMITTTKTTIRKPVVYEPNTTQVLQDIPAQLGSESDPGFSWKDPSKIPARFRFSKVRHTENSAAENL